MSSPSLALLLSIVKYVNKIADVGGSITVHAFGAYFGLAISCIMRPKSNQNESGKYEGSSYTSDIFAMIGTLFLWIFWPSFNSALLDDVAQQQRAILNTYLSLASATGKFLMTIHFICSHALCAQHEVRQNMYICKWTNTFSFCRYFHRKQNKKYFLRVCALSTITKCYC